MFRVCTSRLTGICLIVLACGASGAGYVYQNYYTEKAAIAESTQYATPEESDPYVRFGMEAYDSIMKNYWQKPTDVGLAQFFQLSLQKAANLSTTTLSTQDRAGTARMLASVFATRESPEAKKQLTLDVVKVLLFNLPPVGRAQLLSTQQETALRQEVSNVHPAKDLYGDLGAQSGAAIAAVDDAYTKKVAEVEHSTSSEKAAELARIKYAHQVLSNTETKNRYDTNKVEPTLFSRVIGTTLYIYISKMSPTTLEEFKSAVENASSTPRLESMILDLRGNIGGTLEDAANILGLFIGQNQYAFDLFHQGEYNVIRTPLSGLESLKRYRDIAILTDGMSQSTAEVITAAFKKYNLAYVVGEKTRGWGTVENIFPMQTVIDEGSTYAIMLVQSVTLRDDNQPIEGTGVSPDVDTTQQNWRSSLPTYFRSQSLISAITFTTKEPPLK